MQLFQKLKAYADIQLYSFRKSIRSFQDKNELNIKVIPRPVSFQFMGYLIQNPSQILSTAKRKKVYYEFVLNFIKEGDVYFPFLGMTRAFASVLNENQTKRVFSSIRGTDITVTPLYNPQVIDTYKGYAKNIYKIHFLSEELHDLTLAYGLNYERHKVIYHGVDTNVFQPTALPDINGKLQLLTVGRLHYIKGMELAIFTALALKSTGLDFEWNIIGDGPEKEKIDFLIKSLGLSDSVVLCGPKSRSEIMQFYCNTHLYVHTHLVNGLSNTMLEALACNRRVITFESNLTSYRIPGILEVITEIPKFDYKHMAEEIGRLWQIKHLDLPQEKLSEVLNTFSLEHQTENFIEFFELN